MRQKKTDGQIDRQTDRQTDAGTVTQMLDWEKYNSVSFVTKHSNAFTALFLRRITYEGRNIWLMDRVLTVEGMVGATSTPLVKL